MATLYYRRDRQRWAVDYRRRGVRSKRLFISKRNATEYRRKVEELVEREHVGLSAVELVTFRAFSEMFLRHHFVEKSESYKKTAGYQIETQFLPHFGDLEMTGIELEHIVRWKERREGAVSPKTLREDLCMLHLMFKAAIKNGYALTNPVDDIDLPRNIPNKIRTAVSDDILTKSLRLIDGVDLLAVLLLRNTGLRVGEMFGLRWEDFDFENHMIQVRSTSGNTTKNYQSRVTILTPTAAKIAMKLGSALFPVKESTLKRRIGDVRQRLKWSWDLHSLRHSFVTKLRNANIPERVVAHYVGHAQKGGTDRYTSFTRDFIDASIKAVNFGEEFLGENAVVVPIWSPEKMAPLEDHEMLEELTAKICRLPESNPSGRTKSAI